MANPSASLLLMETLASLIRPMVGHSGAGLQIELDRAVKAAQIEDSQNQQLTARIAVLSADLASVEARLSALEHPATQESTEGEFHG